MYLCTARFSRSARQTLGTKLVVYGTEIDIETGRSLDRPVLLRCPPIRERVAEGPHIVKKDGLYYLFTAEGGTGPGHHVFVTRSHHPLGPYEPPPDGVNPVVFNGNDFSVRRTGHADLTQDIDGKWWSVVLGVRPQDGAMFQLGRETFLSPVEWAEGDWPVFNKGEVISASLPAGLPLSRRPTTWRDDFQHGASSGWYHLRTPIHPIHRVKNGQLTMYGNAHTISLFESPAILLRKQTAYSGVWTTALDFQPLDAYEEAGTTIFYSGESYAAILIRQGEISREVVVRWTDPIRRDIQVRGI